MLTDVLSSTEQPQTSEVYSAALRCLEGTSEMEVHLGASLQRQTVKNPSCSCPLWFIQLVFLELHYLPK